MFQATLTEHCGELVAASEAYLAGIILTRNGTDGLNEELMVGETLAQGRVVLGSIVFAL